MSIEDGLTNNVDHNDEEDVGNEGNGHHAYKEDIHGRYVGDEKESGLRLWSMVVLNIST